MLQVGYMKLYDPAVERMVELLADAPAELVYLSVEVNDPDQAPFVDHLGLVDRPRRPSRADRRDPRPAAPRPSRAALGGGRRTPRQARAFEAYLSALVHDVSLVHHLLGRHRASAAPLPLADAACFDGGRGVSLDLGPARRRRGRTSTTSTCPGVTDYRERVTAYCRDRILELTFPSPYLRHHPTRLVEKRLRGRRRAARPGLTTTEHRVSYEEAFRNELRGFHASITPRRAGPRQCRGRPRRRGASCRRFASPPAPIRSRGRPPRAHRTADALEEA